MLNVTALAGKISSLPEFSDENECSIKIKVQRNYQNPDGDYDYDLFDIILWRGIGEEIVQYCQLNDNVVLRGRIEKRNNRIVIIAEKMNYLK